MPKTTIYNNDIDLVNDDVYTYLVLFCQFILNILSKNRILTSIKGSNSVANLQKAKIYNISIDLVSGNMFTKFGLILSIRSQDIEQKPNSEVNQGP